MAGDVNQVTLSGVVRKVLGRRQTKSGSNNLSLSVRWRSYTGFENQVVVQAYGKLADEVEVEEGDLVLVAGKLSEVRWEDKDEPDTWHARHDIIAESIHTVNSLQSAPLSPAEEDDDDDDDAPLD